MQYVRVANQRKFWVEESQRLRHVCAMPIISNFLVSFVLVAMYLASYSNSVGCETCLSSPMGKIHDVVWEVIWPNVYGIRLIYYKTEIRIDVYEGTWYYINIRIKPGKLH